MIDQMNLQIFQLVMVFENTFSLLQSIIKCPPKQIIEVQQVWQNGLAWNLIVDNAHA